MQYKQTHKPHIFRGVVESFSCNGLHTCAYRIYGKIIFATAKTRSLAILKAKREAKAILDTKRWTH